MFSYNYLKQKTLYYYTDVYINPELNSSCVLLKPLRVSVQFRFSNSKSYLDFLKLFFTLRFLKLLKIKKTKKVSYLKKKEINDWFSLIMINKALVVRSFWLSSLGFCTEFVLNNLHIFSDLEKVFSKLTDRNLEKILFALRIFSNYKKWIFVIYQSIDK